MVPLSWRPGAIVLKHTGTRRDRIASVSSRASQRYPPPEHLSR